MDTFDSSQLATSLAEGGPGQLLCLTILGYRKPGLSEQQYRDHMTQVSAPMTRDLMVRYGIKHWRMIHNTSSSRLQMNHLFDAQMTNLADYDCFSQVVFESVDEYKKMKEDPWYKEKLFNDHEHFADTKRSRMTIGWVTEIIRDGNVVDASRPSVVQLPWPNLLMFVAAGVAVGALATRWMSPRG